MNGNDSGTRGNSSSFDSCDKRKNFGKEVNASILDESVLGGERVFNGGYPFFNCHLNLLLQVARGFGADVGEASSWDSRGEGAWVRFKRSEDSETIGTSFDRLAEPGVVETPGESTEFKAMRELLETTTQELKTKTQELKKAQDELARQGKELKRTKERLGNLSQKNEGLERAAQASKDSAEHYKGLYNGAIDELKRTTQSFEDQLAARDEEKALRDAKFDEVTTKCQRVEQQLQGAEGRCRDMALNVKRKQEMTCKAEERARESEALCKALAEKLQRAEEEAAVASGVAVQVAVSTQTAMEEEVKEPTVGQEKVAEVASVVLVRGEVYTQTDSVVVDHTSNGVVAESEVDLAKEICEARKEVSTLERQNERLNKFLGDITKDYRLMTCGKRPVNGARACGFCRALIAANRSRCFGCGQPAPGTEGYLRARAAMAVTLERN